MIARRRAGSRRPAASHSERQVDAESPARSWGTDVLKERSYVWLLASRFFFLMGGAILVNYFTYLNRRTGSDEDAANVTNLGCW